MEQSVLRQRIQRLSSDEQLCLSLRTEALFNDLMSLDSDADLHNGAVVAARRESASEQQASSVELAVGVVNDYNTLKKSPEVIANERQLDVFQVMKALCSYLFQQPKTLIQSVDLTRANQYFCVEPCVVAEMVDLLLRTDLTPLPPDDLCARLIIQPCYCLLAATLIWLELKCARLANLVEEGWAKITYPTFTPEQFDAANRQLEAIFSELADERLLQDVDEAHGAEDEKLAREVELLQSLMAERREGLQQLVSSVKELDDKLHKRPNLKVETILPDSFDSDCDTPEPSASEEFCIKMQRMSAAKWLGQELDETLLAEELSLTTGEFCFACTGSAIEKKETSPPMPAPPSTPRGSFIMCRVIEIGSGSMAGLMKVRCASASASAKQGPILSVARGDVAIGHAPSMRCPEGTRVIALHHRLVRSADHKSTAKESCWLPGTIGVRPVTANSFEYLVFFDEVGVEDGYVDPGNMRLMLEQPRDSGSGRFEPRYAFKLVERANAKKAVFLRDYLRTYPDWPLVRLKKSSNTMRVLARRGNHQESAFVLDVDRQMCLLRFPGTAKTSFYDKGGRDCVQLECKEHSHVDEWVYRGDVSRLPTLQSQIPRQQGLVRPGVGGSTGTLAFNTQRGGTTANSIRQIRESRSNRMHYEPTFTDYSDEDLLANCLSASNANLNDSDASIAATSKDAAHAQTARKTTRRLPTELPDAAPVVPTFHSGSAVVYLSRQRSANSYKVDELSAPDWISRLATVPQQHEKCSPQCVQALPTTNSEHQRPEFANSSPFMRPLLMGWTRMVYTARTGKGRGVSYGRKVVYRAPCGIRLTCMEDVADYLTATAPNPLSHLLTIDLFTFDEGVNPMRLARPASANSILMGDFAKGEEDVSIGVVNAVDSQPPPRMEYRRWRYSDSAEIEKATESGFCSGCTCTDNCADATRCECQQLTIQSNDRLSASLRASSAEAKTYQHRTLQEKIISGIYECNGTCACSRSHCFNSVVQHRIKVPIELYMTAEIGWGVRTLVDLPAGYFIGTYSGKLLTNEMADRAGIESDAYYAELDLIDVVEVEKRQQGIDLIGGSGGGGPGDFEDEGLGLDNEGDAVSPQPRGPVGDNDEPSALDDELDAYNESLRHGQPDSGGENNEAAGGGPFKFDDYFGDNALFIVDAQQAGNIGRFLNHSCDPNVFVQMVMVDTHDLRLPWIGFFTECAVKAGEELRWNYGYSPGSVPGKELICKCRTSSCQGRLL